MEQKIQVRYTNEHLGEGLTDVKHVYLLAPELTPLFPEVHKGKLVYRAKSSNRRISHDQIKRGLVKRIVVAKEEVPNWLLASYDMKTH